jgi:hypothetical protein
LIGSALVGAPAGAQSLDDAVFARVNQIRQSSGLPLFARNALLDRAAQLHAQDMAQNRFMGHYGSDGSNPARRIREAGYPWTTWAENVAYGYASAEAVMNAWMNSPGHRANILSARVREIGIGVARASTGLLYWCQDFGNRSGAVTPTTPDLDTSDRNTGGSAGVTGTPSIENVSREPGAFGTRIAITGRGLGDGSGACLVLLGVSGTARLESWSDTRIVVFVLDAAPSEGALRVCGPGAQASHPVLFLVWG